MEISDLVVAGSTWAPWRIFQVHGSAVQNIFLTQHSALVPGCLISVSIEIIEAIWRSRDDITVICFVSKNTTQNGHTGLTLFGGFIAPLC